MENLRVSGWLVYGAVVSIIFVSLKIPDCRKDLQAGLYVRLRLRENPVRRW